MTRWNRGLAEHRPNGESEYVGAPPEVEALEELADLVNYLMLMSQHWTTERLSERNGAIVEMTIEIKSIYTEISNWALVDGVDMSSLHEERGEG